MAGEHMTPEYLKVIATQNKTHILLHFKNYQ